ncbi:cell-envelope stress modulator CpxP [Affinibrenneria salicis]|uniref:Cell-envelope stress modulator CpxP n=1 Tax=Affinibrenneria salicis TaxID=2590031 RepID=A0A5J5FY83_9GAMM|nr:cell-envelope stress modulator CpxP [Affinibrenneria salicis]KAA8998576.1 cell-envelope stress modulator CpxP [Affinibrenneria salicis]
MRQVSALSLVSLLVLGSSAAASETDNASKGIWSHDETATVTVSGHQGMFDGVRLTELQRQQMRDLMQLARQELPELNTNDVEVMHRLIIAEKFDEAAVRAQAEKMAQRQVVRQVEMAKVRNQMYNLLTSEQKQILAQKHQQRMESMRQQMDRVNQASARKQ